MRLVVCALACVSLLVVACGGDDGVVVVNQPPTITWDFNPLGVARISITDLNVTVSDPDEDDILTVTWSVIRGALIDQDGVSTRREYRAPDLVGPDTVTVTVSDGEFSSTVVEEILVGTRWTGSLDRGFAIDSSPYIIAPSGGIAVSSSGGSIEAGVEFLINSPGGSIQIEAVFTTQGTANSPVVIRPNDRRLRCQSQRGWWEGIEVRGTGHLTMNYTDITYGVVNVRLLDSGRANLNNCEIKCGEEYGVLVSCSGPGYLVLDGCDVTNNASVGVGITSLTALPDSVVIRNSSISINGNRGIEMDLRDPGQQVDIVVEYNMFEFNFTHGIYLTNNVFPQIHYNHFDANGLSGGLSNLRLQFPYPRPGVTFPTLDATNNYWGGPFSDQAAVDAGIHDSLDDSRLGTRVQSDPWLQSSPLP